MEAMNILVTGANGLIGYRLCGKLLDQDYTVLALSRRENPALLKPLLDHPRLTLLKGDVTDPAFTSNLLRNYQINVVFHLAVERYFPDRRKRNTPILLQETAAYRTNFEGTLNLLQSAGNSGVSAWIQSSAMMVYDIENTTDLPVSERRPPTPVEPNGMSVFLAEQACQYFGRTTGLNYLILRYPGVFGRGKESGIITKLVRHCLGSDKTPLEVATDRTSDFLYAEDAATANLMAMKKLLADASAESRSAADHSINRIFHIGSGREISVAEVARLISRLTGGRGNIIEKPSGKPRRFYFDISAARRELGFQPRPLEEGLAEYIREMKEVLIERG